MSHTFKGHMTSVDELRVLAVVGAMTSHVDGGQTADRSIS